jgi:cell division protein FtsA
LVDIGSGTTDMAIYIDGAVWHTCVLDLGGSHFTSDLALCLRLPLETAEQIKVTQGHCNPEDLPMGQPFIAAGFGDEDRISVHRSEVAEILHARAEELFGLILEEVKRSGYDGLLPAGLVITGGGSLLPGLREVARQATGLPARLALPTDLRGLVDTIQSPAYATGIGLIKWGLHDVMARPSRRRRAGWQLNLRGWLSNLLPDAGSGGDRRP